MTAFVKTISIFFTCLCATICSHAASKNPIAGPNGGKLLENSVARAEFLIAKDNHVIVSFYDENLKPVPVAEQVVSIIAAPKAGKMVLHLEKKNGALISHEPLPKSAFFDEYQITVEVKLTAESKAEMFKLRFDLDVCQKCKLKEYACICRP